ncbi:MAG: alcohol dehydrogenase catalytic domain-containing protein [Armatimonadetes bacterium]|nr:alcohol dehydrogenase catalytic domain-containing protein [Armatimonadota bacterium]
MKKAAITGERSAELLDVPDPRPRDNWAVVKVLTAPMCTEYKAWLAGGRAEFLGHEAAGEVVAVDRPCRVKPGDRVVVMPQYPCGVCDLCIEGEYIHCQHLVNAAEFTGSPSARSSCCG